MDFLNRKSVNQSRDYIRITLEQYNSSIYSWAQKASEYATWVSWGFGADYLLGMKLPNSIDEMNPTNIKKTNILFELAIQPIVTNWYFHLGRRVSRSWEEN